MASYALENTVSDNILSIVLKQCYKEGLNRIRAWICLAKSEWKGNGRFLNAGRGQVRTVPGCSCRVELNPQPVLCKAHCCLQLQAGGLGLGGLWVTAWGQSRPGSQAIGSQCPFQKHTSRICPKATTHYPGTWNFLNKFALSLQFKLFKLGYNAYHVLLIDNI